MRAGALDRRITLQRGVAVQDDFNQPVKSWEEIATVWAEVRPVGGGEGFDAQQLKATADVRIAIRYRDDVTPETRVVYGSQVHDILAIQEIGRREGLELITRARAE
jgi:SPP1 family predicted phage head-tail adaptor